MQPIAERAKSIFFAAIEMPSANEQQQYIEEACGTDVELRDRVQKLLAAHLAMGSIHEQPDEPGHEQVGSLIGRYKLLEEIGEGGMGVVYMAQQSQPVKRRVALKLIKPGMDTRQVIARFEAERQALALMDHPHIARVLDAGATEAGRPYFVMELIHGVPITEYCDREQLDSRRRLELMIDVCRAVQHAHQKAIIHRDLKPSNVLVTLHDGQAVVKVIDFGVAKALDQELTERTLFTQFSQMVGTPLYMSPEQAALNTADIDTRSDVYSLGVLLYELLTGTTPFDRELVKNAGFDELRRIIREDDPPRPSERISTLRAAGQSTVSLSRQGDPRKLSKMMRGELDWIVMKALEKDRSRRYETANEFAADLLRYLHDEPVQACPPSVPYQLHKFVRRNKRGLAAAGVLGLALLIAIGAVSGSIGWVVSDRAVRWKEVDRAVNAALTESKRLQDQLKPGEALLQVKQASAILASGPSTPALQQRVRERLDDLEFVLELEGIRADWGATQGRYTEDILGQTDRRFTATFRQFGVDFDSLTPDEAALRLRQRTVAVEVAAALDTWVFVSRRPNVGKTGWQRLLAVARAIDPEPTRSKLREIVEREDNEALRALLKTIRVEELSAQTALFFANALEVAGNREDSLKVLLLAQLRHPADYWLCAHLSFRQVGRSSGEDMLRFSALAVALHPQAAVDHYTLGATLLDRGRVDEAIAACRESLRLKSDDAGALIVLGNALRSKGDLEEAIAAYREAIRLRPDYHDARNNLGIAFAAQGNLDEAIACWRETVRLATPKAGRYVVAVAHTNLGDALARQGKWHEALASFREAVSLKPDFVLAHNNMAWLLANCPDRSVRDAAQAVESAQKAVALEPQAGGFWNTLGVAHYRAGNWNDAIAALGNSIAIGRGGNSFDFFFLAMAHRQLDEKVKAHKWHHQAVEWMEKHQPQNEELLRFRAEAAELLGVEDESKTDEVPPPKPQADSSVTE